MAGFGRQLVRGLGAAMQGYGKTLTDQAEEQKRERELDGAMMRQKALADYSHGLSLDTLEKTADANVAEHKANAQTDTAEAINRLGPATDAKIRLNDAENAQKFKLWQQQQSIEFKNKLTLQQQHDAFEAAKQDDQQAHEMALEGRKEQHDLDSNPIGTFEAADGTPVAFYGLGAKNRYTKFAGAHMPRKAGEDDGSGSGGLASLRGGGHAGRGGAGVGPPPEVSAPAAAATGDYTLYRTMLAESATHPAFQGMSAEDRIKRVRALAGTEGIPVPPTDDF